LESGPAEGQPAEGSGQRWRLLDDPVAIRALAHPLRHELMSIIASHGLATTAEAARELGISHGLASHHLRQLAKYGFVEQVAGKDQRERPWRAAAAGVRWPDQHDSPEAAAATGVLEQVLAERVLDGFLSWQQRRAGWPAAWLDGAGLGTATLYLTAAELSEMTAAFGAMVARYEDRRATADAGPRPDGALPVDVSFIAVPGPVPPPAEA